MMFSTDVVYSVDARDNLKTHSSFDDAVTYVKNLYFGGVEDYNSRYNPDAVWAGVYVVSDKQIQGMDSHDVRELLDNPKSRKPIFVWREGDQEEEN